MIGAKAMRQQFIQREALPQPVLISDQDRGIWISKLSHALTASPARRAKVPPTASYGNLMYARATSHNHGSNSASLGA